MLGDFFAARPEAIDETLVDEGPHGRVSTIEAKNHSEVTIATLGEILGAGTYDDLVERAAEGPQADSGESGVLHVPSEIRDALASVDEPSGIAKQWAATDELADWEIDWVEGVLRELIPLARRAKSDGQDLWYWWSL